MTAHDRLVVRLSTQDVAGYLRHRGGRFERVRPYTRKWFKEAIRKAAMEYQRGAVERESTLTPIMDQLARGEGGHLVDVDYRVKSEVRIMEKIEARLVERQLTPQEAERVRVSDALRFTMVFDDEHYAKSSLATLDRLKRFGFTVESKNYWHPGEPYDGVNVALTDPSGFPIELQLHTPESKRVATLNHPLYKQVREIMESPTRSRNPVLYQRAKELWAQMIENASTIPIPPGVEHIPGERWMPFPDLPPLSASSISGGETEGSL